MKYKMFECNKADVDGIETKHYGIARYWTFLGLFTIYEDYVDLFNNSFNWKRDSRWFKDCISYDFNKVYHLYKSLTYKPLKIKPTKLQYLNKQNIESKLTEKL